MREEGGGEQTQEQKKKWKSRRRRKRILKVSLVWGGWKGVGFNYKHIETYDFPLVTDGPAEWDIISTVVWLRDIGM